MSRRRITPSTRSTACACAVSARRKSSAASCPASHTTCNAPSRSCRSMKMTPPMSRRAATQPQADALPPTSSVRKSPQYFVRIMVLSSLRYIKKPPAPRIAFTNTGTEGLKGRFRGTTHVARVSGPLRGTPLIAGMPCGYNVPPTSKSTGRVRSAFGWLLPDVLRLGICTALSPPAALCDDHLSVLFRSLRLRDV